MTAAGWPRPVLTAIAVLLLIVVVAPAAFLLLCVRMPGESYRGPLPAPDPELLALRERLRRHVRELAEEIGERNYTRMQNLERAADYVERQFADMGLVPASQVFGDRQYRNISVDLYGREARDRILVVGAHYDTVWLTPGADDNASGVAGLLEIARALRERPLRRTVRLIAFSNEEEPFYGRNSMGSRVNAKRAYDRREQLIGMFSLEMIGFYSDAPRSQFYPRIIRRFYPDRGDFIAFVSNLRSRSFLHEAIAAFRERAAFPSEGLAAPEILVPDIRRSDNVSFWYYGFPAVMVTDTSNYRNYNYHNAGDLYGTLDFDRLARVVTGLSEMIADLAGR